MWTAEDNSKDELSNSELTRLTTQLISAYSSRNALTPDDLLKLIDVVRNKLGSVPTVIQPLALEAPQEPETPSNPKLVRSSDNPAVNPKKSVHKDYIICLEDGERVKMLKRYIKTHYDLEPSEYIARWNLPSDYPFVCKSLSDARSETAKRVRPSDSKKKGSEGSAHTEPTKVKRFKRVLKTVPPEAKPETKVSGPASIPSFKSESENNA
ncbi:MucR family transcriptional regulator [Gluconobacter wancherniae]|uniref:MucR family transcriptional regulator n=1 Tax=Gluconobacter wancherniae TaxID=1307955 RepID=UPI001B8D8E54|nr:MucR family transcriptional regulator [Gluconobacter wancherniae]MBS1089931.1 MucR family transcriptional regulator [Gluconobacter wancherniae]